MVFLAFTAARYSRNVRYSGFAKFQIGTIPLDYLDAEDEFKADSIYANARQILQQFEVKRHQKMTTTLSFLYRPFRALTPAIQADAVRQIQQSIREKNFDTAIERSRRLIELALEGLTYYHSYDRVLLGASIASGFLGWMTYVVTLVLQNHTSLVKADALHHHSTGRMLNYVFTVTGAVVALFLYIQSQKWTYYVYTELSVILWCTVLKRFHIVESAFQYLKNNQLLVKASLMTLVALASLELLVLSFFSRELLTVGLIGMAAWSLTTSIRATHRNVVAWWIISCVAVSVFPLLPVVGHSSNYFLVYLAGSLAAVAAICNVYRKRAEKEPGTTVNLTLSQISLLMGSVYLVWSSVSSRESNTGLPFLNQSLSWIILVSAFVLPLLSNDRVTLRLEAIFLAFLPSYLLLSISHEGLFYLMLCLLMFCWVDVESQQKISSDQPVVANLHFGETTLITRMPRQLVAGDLRCAYFFIFFLLAAFFGTGNIASINSFDPTSILCFVTVFNPFVMGALMLWKILIPFLLVTCTFNAIHLAINVPTQSLFLIVLIMSDFMALHFFFLVRDYGSWLEIGMSISHYVIVMAMISFLFLLLMLSKFFTDCSMDRLLSRVLRRKSHEQ